MFVLAALVTSPAAADQCMCLGAPSPAPWTGPHDWDHSSPTVDDASVVEGVVTEVARTTAEVENAKHPGLGELSSPPEIMSYVIIARDVPTDEEVVLWCEGGDDPRCVPALPTTDAPSDLTPPTVRVRKELDESAGVNFTHGFVRQRGPAMGTRDRLERPPR